MSTFLVVLIALAMAATVFFLVKGVVTFLKTTEADLRAGPDGPSVSSRQQNKMMSARIGFQAVAVLLVALLLLMSRHG
ncbi:twin transmembrane helix small protein [Sphingomonas sp.]|uniref:twin transmembrane helix small protein n=1 Tax=Sphingomonas sp. TaxID=28214 RepID=UPI0025EA3746|nr:twin transmembrane helix small protein [Sphingomonas sp.]